VRRALQWAVSQGLPSVTLVHKGNIMKFTEGSFAQWGYEVAAGVRRHGHRETTVGRARRQDARGQGPRQGPHRRLDLPADPDPPGRVQRARAPNLNGDYLSDAAIALVGGLGLGPGANMSDEVALFEATHGTAPKYTGLDKVNPGRSSSPR
jgi:isocitrate dehydrogenase